MLDAVAMVFALGRLDLSDRQAVFIFGDATHVVAAARIASDELVQGRRPRDLFREFGREIREAAKRYDVEPLISDDYLEVEAKVAELQPELVLGTQMERHIAKRLGIPCAVISARCTSRIFRRDTPADGFEGANVIFDTWVHPLMMGLEEHLLAMFRETSNSLMVRCRRIWARAMRARRRSAGYALRPGQRAAFVSSGIAVVWAPTPSGSCARSPSSFAARRAATPNASPTKMVSPP